MTPWITDLKVEGDGVDGDDGFSGKVLQSPSEEGLGEEESTDPEHRWDPIIDPSLQEINPLQQVTDP